ncbi:MAG: MFS transporter [Clostridiales bacterium]|nr:MFS transporter [Clostridiales bacterium]
MTASQATRTKRTCYFTYLAMASVFSLPAILFGPFKELYGISYTLLGTLVLVNFVTQLTIDLIFTFFSKYFNVHKALRFTPLITATGLLTYALVPLLFPSYAYLGLVIGTVIFSVAAGLGEVLISPTVAALPSETPDKDMSVLHSLYGYGCVSVILISTLFIQFVGKEYWQYLVFFFAVLPVVASIFLCTSKLPEMTKDSQTVKTEKTKHRTISMLLCVLCIFFGSCAENAMTNWISAFAEKSLAIPKVWGDIFGMALFAALLAVTRTLYAKFGKNIFKTLVISMSCAVVCYLVVAISPWDILSLIASVLLGVFTSMLWPGTLILMEEKIPAVGVAAYALMAAGGDLGAALSPQALGIIVDNVAVSGWANNLATTLMITPEQLGFKVGMIAIAVFPLLGLIVLGIMRKHFKKPQLLDPKNT